MRVLREGERLWVASPAVHLNWLYFRAAAQLQHKCFAFLYLGGFYQFPRPIAETGGLGRERETLKEKRKGHKCLERREQAM